MNIGTHVKRALAVGSIFAAFAAPALAITEVAGVKLPDTERVANQDLKLNGAGVRYKAIFKVYVAGLYLAEKKTTVPDVMAAAGAKRVTIVMLRDVGNEEFGRGFMTGIQQNLEKTEKTKLIAPLQKFGEMFASIPELKKGDIITADWIPGTGMLMLLNGKKTAEVIPDPMFYNALLKIWLGDKPLDAKLKKLMLGEKPEEGNRSSNY